MTRAPLGYCLFVSEFYGPVNNEVMLSQSVNSGTVPGQVRPSKRVTSTKRGRPRQLVLGSN